MPALFFPDGARCRQRRWNPCCAVGTLGQPVTLARESDIPHFDAEAIHILTTASLAWLRQALPDGKVDERRFRPNLLLDAAGAGPVEQQWHGKTLRVGDQLKLRITDATERCRMVTLAQGELPEDLRVLREIAQRQDAQFGVYAKVLEPGEVRVGDPVRIE